MKAYFMSNNFNRQGDFMKLILPFIFLFSSNAFAARYMTVPVLSACAMATNCISTGVDLNQLALGSMQAVFTGSPVGSLKLQISSDNVAPCDYHVSADPACNVVNWVDYTGSTQAVSSSGNFMWNLTFVGYRWLRVVYTATSGSGSLSATATGKSVSQ